VPVVATHVAGIPELVRDGHSGLLVSPGDASAAGKAIYRLLEDTDMRNRFATAGRESIEREFNIQTETRWLATILTSALAGESEGIRP
jgi:colanic acid/amylovoran biosynthesis glycosyltransferase